MTTLNAKLVFSGFLFCIVAILANGCDSESQCGTEGQPPCTIQDDGGTTDDGSTCTPESDTTFCARLGKACGNTTTDDNCGNSRSVSCGSCNDPLTCNDQSGQCVAADPCADYRSLEGTWSCSAGVPFICSLTLIPSAGKCYLDCEDFGAEVTPEMMSDPNHFTYLTYTCNRQSNNPRHRPRPDSTPRFTLNQRSEPGLFYLN